MSQTDPAFDWQVGSRFIGQFTDNQLAVSHVADWSTRQLVDSLTANFLKSWN